MLHARDIRDRLPVPPRRGGAGPEEARPPLPAGVEVGPVRWRELPAVARVQRRAFRPALAYSLTTLLALRLLPRVRFLVARRDEVVVGCAIGDRHDGNARVINLAVDPEARRQGIGVALLRALEEALPGGDVLLMVEASRATAQGFSPREGQVAVGRWGAGDGGSRGGVGKREARGGTGGSPSPPKLRV